MNNSKLNVHIRPFGFLDLLAFKKLVPSRDIHIEQASAGLVPAAPPCNVLAQTLHPRAQHLRISEIRRENPSATTYRLVPAPGSDTHELAYFLPGQYLSFSFELEGATVTRPYSLSSSPKEALAGFYEITVKHDDQGFVSRHIQHAWEQGTQVVSSGPQGLFHHDSLRDAGHVLAIAGGCGITPFRSMARSILDGSLDISLTILVGSRTRQDLLFEQELKDIQEKTSGKVTVVAVLSEETVSGYAHGFIGADLIRQHMGAGPSSLFICGPQPMYAFLQKGLPSLNLREKAVRWEHFGEIHHVAEWEGYPTQAAGRVQDLTVHMDGKTHLIKARSDETLLVAMERAGLCPPSSCRSGACGFCRSLLLSGEVFIPPEEDGRRAADKLYGYVHPCGAFPVSALEIAVPGAR